MWSHFGNTVQRIYTKLSNISLPFARCPYRSKRPLLDLAAYCLKRGSSTRRVTLTAGYPSGIFKNGELPFSANGFYGFFRYYVSCTAWQRLFSIIRRLVPIRAAQCHWRHTVETKYHIRTAFAKFHRGGGRLSGFDTRTMTMPQLGILYTSTRWKVGRSQC